MRGVTLGSGTRAYHCWHTLIRVSACSFSMNDNDIGKDGAVAIANALPECKALVTLRCVQSDSGNVQMCCKCVPAGHVMTGAGNMGMGMGMRMRRWSIRVHGRCHTPHHCHAMPSIDNNGIEDVHLKSIQAILERNKAERAAAELAGAVREAAVEKAAMVKALAEAAKASEEL